MAEQSPLPIEPRPANMWNRSGPSTREVVQCKRRVLSDVDGEDGVDRQRAFERGHQPLRFDRRRKIFTLTGLRRDPERSSGRRAQTDTIG